MTKKEIVMEETNVDVYVDLADEKILGRAIFTD